MVKTTQAPTSNFRGGKFLFPLAQQPGHVPTKEELEEKRKIEELKRLYSRVKDREGFTDSEARAYALMYNDLAPGDINGQISVKRVKQFFDEFIQQDNPSIYNKMLSYYELNGAHPFADKKLEKILRIIQNYMEGIRSLDNAMKYSVAFEEAANKIAVKLEAPDTMSILERVKWIRLWFLVLRDHEFFFNELTEQGSLKGPKTTEEVNQMYFFPESMINLYENYLSTLPDGDILYDMIKSFIDGYPEDVQQAVYRFAELDGVNRPDCCRLGRIREDVKKKLFPNSWRSSTSYFMTVEGIKFFLPSHLKMAVLAYKNGGTANMPTFQNKVTDVFNGYKKRTVTVYKYGENSVNDQHFELGVSCEQELLLYVNLYKWLLAHPDFKFGQEGKTIEEYDMTDLLLDAKAPISAWILENGYASSEEDINWIMADNVLKPDKNGKLFKDYYEGTISGDDVFHEIGFNSDKLARMCLSFNGLALFDKTDVERALRRVKMFGLDHSLKSDQIYFKLYKYLLESDVPCGAKKKPVSAYGIRYTF